MAIAERDVFGRLSTLSDETRARLLLRLEDQEFTVTELCQALQLPQSTVSRHLKLLSDDGWVHSRTSGTSRHYSMSVLDGAAAELWAVVRERVAAAPIARQDVERSRVVLARRRERSRRFFSTAAMDWDRRRDELFGRDSTLWPLFGLLDRAWTVADFGAGTGALTERLAPFVKRVVAVDSSTEMLDALGQRLEGASNVEVCPGELESLPIESDTVDVAFMVLVLHYVPDPRAAIAEATRVLRPGGRLVLVDMREHEREEYRAEMGHVWPGFSVETVAGWALRAGLEVAAHVPLAPDPVAKGPLLFLATLRKATASARPPEKNETPGNPTRG